MLSLCSARPGLQLQHVPAVCLCAQLSRKHTQDALIPGTSARSRRSSEHHMAEPTREAGSAEATGTATIRCGRAHEILPNTVRLRVYAAPTPSASSTCTSSHSSSSCATSAPCRTCAHACTQLSCWCAHVPRVYGLGSRVLVSSAPCRICAHPGTQVSWCAHARKLAACCHAVPDATLQSSRPMAPRGPTAPTRSCTCRSRQTR